MSALDPGSRLGVYEILSLIDSGGMGEVYRARDPRLGRDVAVKVLPCEYSSDADRLRRFEQEARAAAALNHPNVLTVHEIASADGVPYIVSELLEGQTLRKILSRGPVLARAAIAYAVQVLNGLAAAHDKGIVHRDLKPENLFVTNDGRVKILDFGIAKLLDPTPPSELATRLADTTPGVILGTLAYMSPEQVRGQVVDHRSDLFSFGAILYEMLSGQRVFQRESPAETISAILTSDPGDLSAVMASPVQPGLERIVEHCLEKEPARRFQSARDLTFDLESLSGTSVATRVNEDRARSTRSRWFWLAAAAAAGVVGGGLAAWRLKPVSETTFVRNATRVAHDANFSAWPTWSNDGRTFAFGSNRTGNFEIYLGSTDGSKDVTNLTRNPADNVQPAFSPDGERIAFVSTRPPSRSRLINTVGDFSGGDIWVMTKTGGSPMKLAPDGNSPAWHPNGRSIAYVSGKENQRTILEVDSDGGTPRAILPADRSTWEIVSLAYRPPDGRWIIFATSDGRVWTLPASGGTPAELLIGRTPAWTPSGQQLVFLSGTTIETADIEEGRTSLSVARTRTVGVNTGNTGSPSELAIDPRDSTHLLMADDEESYNLTRILLTPAGDDVAGPEEPLSTGQVRDRYPSVSPDGRHIVLGSNRDGPEKLWTVNLPSLEWQRVAMSPRAGVGNAAACWLNNESLAVTTVSGRPSLTNSLWQAALDGSSFVPLAPPASAGAAIATGAFPCSASPDGQAIVFRRLIGRFTQLVRFDLASQREQPLTTTPSDKYEASWSPTGQWIAFAANTDGALNVWRIPATGGGGEDQLTRDVDRIRHLFYSPDGTWLYLQPNHRNIYRMPANGGPHLPVTHFADNSNLYIEEPAISPDGRYLVYARGHGSSSIWLMSLSDRQHR